MTEPDTGLEWRLYGMMQFLMAKAAQGETPVSAAPRGAIELQDALDAVLQVAAVIDEAFQAGLLGQRGVHAGAMLMVIRDYLQPLPVGLADDGATDHATADLAELVAAIRQARTETGMHG